jgi:transcriptional regulator with PAS, ATPase and Fis domain
VRQEEEIFPGNGSKEHLNLRLIVTIPTVFILVSLSVGLLAMALTQFILHAATPSSKDLLILRLSIVGSSLLAGFLGSLLAYAITKPVRRAILEAQRMIRYVEEKPHEIKATNEVRALSTLFDQAYVSFIELVQAREVLDSINDGIMAMDREGKVVGMNLSAQEMLEIPLSEARHKSLSDLLGGTPVNRVLLALAQSVLKEHQERGHNHVPLCSPSGKEFLLSVRVSPIKLRRESSELLGAILTLSKQQQRSAEIPEIVGRSEPLMEVLDLAAKVAPTDSTVLLTGESGTGKELVANAIHRMSRRKDKPYIKLNCAAIPEGLLESELFGHEKGAFTGAVNKKAGQFELADGGTVFLDEIGDMSPSTQAKVLRVLQQREFSPVGGNQVKQVDVRIIAATNKDLPMEVQTGKFREDLFYRLNVMTISIPPLRQRKTDIPFLADFFLENIAKRSNTQQKCLSRSALDSLLAYSWPGNIRELENAIERASLLSRESIIQPDDLPIPTESSSANSPTGQSQINKAWLDRQTSLNETLETVEKELIIQALRKSNGVQTEAAKILRLNHKNLWHKIRKHKITSIGLKDSSPVKSKNFRSGS